MATKITIKLVININLALGDMGTGMVTATAHISFFGTVVTHSVHEKGEEREAGRATAVE